MLLLLRGCADIVHRKEGVTQGDELSMILYRLGVLPITQALKHHVDDNECKSRRNTLQMWYANYSALDSYFYRIKAWSKELIRIGPSIRYYLNLGKSLLIMLEDNLDIATTLFSE